MTSPRWSRQLLRRTVRNPSALAGSVLVGVVVMAVLLGPLVAPDPANTMNLNALNQEPSGTHWLGTDFLGRDVLTRLLYGGRLSLAVAMAVLVIESGIGVSLGLAAGYGGKALDSLIMRLMDVLLTVPGLLLALGIVAILGPGLQSVAIALGVAGAPGYARMARAMTLRAREQDYIAAARAQGGGAFHIVRHHILANILDPLIVMATISVGGAVIAASALSYLGVGAQPPTADWGALLSEGYEHMFDAWSEMVFPGIAVAITVLGANLLGDGLTDALDPRR